MKLIFHIVILIFYITATNSSLYNNIKDNFLTFLNGPVFRKESLRNGEERVDVDTFKVARTQYPEVDDEDENEFEIKIDDFHKRDVWKKDDKSQERTRTPNFGKQKDIYVEPRITPPKPPEYLVKMIHPNIQVEGEPEDRFQKRLNDDMRDVETAQSKAQILKRAKHVEEGLNNMKGIASPKAGSVSKQHYHMDPVLNLMRSQDWRRAAEASGSGSGSSSSSREMRDWKEEWKEHWMLKKFEALNASAPRGDIVNMVAARPWGVPCGDPNQHDMPWGSCMLAAECEGEFRIYRGDFFCGHTEFVCCAIQLTNYDLYQGFDVSFDEKSLSTDSEEKRNAGKGSKEKKRRHQNKERKHRRQGRERRKRRIKRSIKKIIREIRKIMNKLYRNGTSQRKKKTKMLKKFIKSLKKQYRNDRQSVKELHEEQMMKIDAALMNRLNQIRAMNQEFMNNATFRDIVVNGTITKKQARMLVEAYPELNNFLETRRSGYTNNPDRPKDYLEYDIEYGYLYY